VAHVVGIVGAGLVGRAGAVAFARGGWTVRVWDPSAEIRGSTLAGVGTMAEDLAAAGLLDEPAATLAGRVTVEAALGDALAGAAWVQESAPERLEVKQALWAELDRLAPEGAVLASSTSAIVPSRFTDGLAGRARCLVAHPLNPPHVIPAVELVPAPWTDAATIDRAECLMRGIGMVPIVMRKELDGFVMNRLQAALVEEAMKLVAAGYCGPEDVDVGLKDGLALRWSFMGPFETIDLNAPGGVRDYVTRYRGVFDTILAAPLPRPDWAGPLLDELEAQRRLKLLEPDLAARRSWRDRRLSALLAHKRAAGREIGD